jgi:hypothetical protein
MADLINLNKARKARVRAEDKSRASANRVRFGLTTGQKVVAKLDAARAQRELNGKKRGD